MPRLLSQAEVARRLRMDPRRFRRICELGEGPPVFAPDGGRPQWVDTVVDAWMVSRDDRKSLERAT